MVSNNRAINIWSSEINKNTNGLRDLDKVLKDNKDAVVGLVDGVLENANIVGKLTQVIQKAEKLQTQSLSMGMSYSKFVQQNTKAIHNSVSTQQEMTEALLIGFGQGLRNNTDELNGLIDEMNVTNQNTSVLTMTMSNLSVLTADSQDAQAKMSKTFTRVSKDYGISYERLSKSLDGISREMDSFSIYGPEASLALGELKTGLLGLAGGKPAAERQIDILLKMGDALNVSQQEMFGLTTQFESLRDGVADISDWSKAIHESGAKLEKIMSKDGRQAQSIAETYGREQVQAMIQLGRLFENNYELTKEQKAAQEDRDALIKNRQREIDKWYQEYAPQIHNTVTKVLPSLMGGLLTARLGKQAGTFLTGDSRFAGLYQASLTMGATRMEAMRTAGSMTGSVLGRAGPIGGAARLGLAALAHPGVVIGLTALTVGLPFLIDLFKEDKDANKDAAKSLREMNARSRNMSGPDAGLRMAANIAQNVQTGEDSAETLRQIKAVLEKINRNTAKARQIGELNTEVR